MKPRMTNHTRTPYHVVAYPGDLLGKFQHSAIAMRVAQMWSARWNSWTEVSAPDGLIAQFDKGQPSPEFEHVCGVIAAEPQEKTED